MSSVVVDQLKEKVGADKVLVGQELKQRYVHIWQMEIPLKARAVVLPKSTEDVSNILKICHEHDQAVVIHGGLTNLVGSTETEGSEIVISLEKMNQIEEVDEKSRSMTVQAGVILQVVQNVAHEHGLLFPLNFGAKGSAQIGGVISTNAGGLRVLKYGMTRHLVLGIEAVLADGTIISSMKKIIKDNSGYDLKQLFIGTEGTLGVITKAVLKLSEAPKSRTSAFVGINGYEKVVSFLKYMDGGLAGGLSGFELIWKETYKVMTSPPALVGPPLPYDFEYFVLLETHGSDRIKDQEKLEKLLAAAIEQGMIGDAAIADTESDLNWFWTIREDVHIFVAHLNNEQHFDISLPIPMIGEVIQRMVENLKQVREVEAVYPFGHVADGNMHLIIGKTHQSDDLIHRINNIIYRELKSIGGSVSAEHGIGVHKKTYLHHSRTEPEIELMKTIKKSLDPKNILNPGKIFDL